MHDLGQTTDLYNCNIGTLFFQSLIDPKIALATLAGFTHSLLLMYNLIRIIGTCRNFLIARPVCSIHRKPITNEYVHRRQSIGVHGVWTPPVFGCVVSTYMWTPPEFLTT